MISIWMWIGNKTPSLSAAEGSSKQQIKVCGFPVFPAPRAPTRYTTLLVSISFGRAYKSTNFPPNQKISLSTECTPKWVRFFGAVDLLLIIYVNPTNAVTFICLAEYLSGHLNKISIFMQSNMVSFCPSPIYITCQQVKSIILVEFRTWPTVSSLYY